MMEKKQKIIELYKSILDKLKSEKDRFKEKDVCIFFTSKGSQFAGEYLFVGRAVNGWGYSQKKEELSFPGELEKSLVDHYGKDDLEWVIQQFGPSTTKDTYNTKKSAFWRVINRFSEAQYKRGLDSINSIAWTNLYKLSNAEGGNPSARLIDLQYEKCKEILEVEIELLNPKNAIFFTGYGWAKWFFNIEEFINVRNSPSNYIDFVGTHKTSNRKYIVCRHPMGKPEDEFVNGLMKIVGEN